MIENRLHRVQADVFERTAPLGTCEPQAPHCVEDPTHEGISSADCVDDLYLAGRRLVADSRSRNCQAALLATGHDDETRAHAEPLLNHTFKFGAAGQPRDVFIRHLDDIGNTDEAFDEL